MTEMKFSVRAVDAASSVVRRVRGEVDGLGRSLGRQGASGAMAHMNKTSSALMSSMATAVIGIGAVTVAVRTLTSAIRENIEVDKNLAEIGTLLGDMEVDMGAVKRQLLDLGAEAGQGMQSLTKGMYDAISAGVAFKDSMSFMRDAAVLAQGGLVEIATSVDHLTSVMNAYKIEAKNVQTVSDAAFTAVRGGKTTIQEMSKYIGQLAPVAKAAGLSIKDMYAAVATVTKSGINTRLAMTGIKSTINSLLAPAEQARKEFDRLEISISSQRIATEGLLPVMRDLYKATGGNFEAMQKLVPSVEALPALLSLVSGDAEELAYQMGEMENAAGAAEKASAKMYDTLDNKLKRLSGSWTRAKIQLGEDLEPVIIRVADKLHGFLEMFRRPDYTPTQDLTGDLKSLIADVSGQMAVARTNRKYGQLEVLAAQMTEYKSLLESVKEGQEEIANFSVPGITEQVASGIEDAVEMTQKWTTAVATLKAEKITAMKDMAKEQKKYNDIAKKAALEQYNWERKLFERSYELAGRPKDSAVLGVVTPDYSYEETVALVGREMADAWREADVAAAAYAKEQDSLAARAQQHSLVLAELARQENIAEGLTGNEKISALKRVQATRAKYADSYVTQTGDIIDAIQAEAEAASANARIQTQIQEEYTRMLETRAVSLNTARAEVDSIEAKIQEAEMAIQRVAEMVFTLHAELEKGVTMYGTLNALARVRREIEQLDLILAKPRAYVVKAEIEASPRRPFSEGIKHMREELGSLQGGQDFTLRHRGGSGSASFTANITVNGGGGAGTAREIDSELASMWKSRRSELRQVMEG